jgi:hypothetical protein
MEIGKRNMKKNTNLKSGDSPWGDWIRTYAGPTPNSEDTLAYWLRETQIINTKSQTAGQDSEKTKMMNNKELEQQIATNNKKEKENRDIQHTFPKL